MCKNKNLSEIPEQIISYFTNHYKEYKMLWADSYQKQNEIISYGGKNMAEKPIVKETYCYKLAISCDLTMIIEFTNDECGLRIDKIMTISPDETINYIINIENSRASNIVDILYGIFKKDKIKSQIEKYTNSISIDETVSKLIAEGKFYLLAKMLEQNFYQMNSSLYVIGVNKNNSFRQIIFGSLLFQLLNKRKKYMLQNDESGIAIIDKIITDYNLDFLEQITIDECVLKKGKTVNNGYGHLVNLQAEQITKRIISMTTANGELEEDYLLYCQIVNSRKKVMNK